MAEGYKPTKGMQIEAEKAIKWREEGFEGGTRIGLIRARQIMRGENLSRDTVMRMYSFFSRHEPDKKAEGFEVGEKGYPSKGRVAWGLWGGDAGYSWSEKLRNRIVKEEQEKGYKMESIVRTANLTRNNYEDDDEMYEGRENCIWTVVVSTPEVDRHDTIVVPSGIDYSAYMSNPVVLGQHETGEYPVGKCLGFFLNGENLEATIQLDMDDEEARKINKKITNGFVNAVSVGIIAKTMEEETIDGKKIKVYPTSELVEFSIVSVPSNRGSLIKRNFQTLLSEFIQKYKEEQKMLTPEIEQKIKEELLPAVKEAIVTELANLGFSIEEAQTAVEAMVAVGADALLLTLAGEQVQTPEQVVEEEPATPPADVVAEESPADENPVDDMEDDEEVRNYSAPIERVGKKISANTEMQIKEGLAMIKQGYRAIHDAAKIAGTMPNKSNKSIPQAQITRKIELKMPVAKSTKELLELI